MKKRCIIQLIKDDVKITLLISALENLNIKAYHYHLQNSIVVLYLLDIQETEESKEFYNLLIESATVKSLTELDKFSNHVYNQLLNHEKFTRL